LVCPQQNNYYKNFADNFHQIARANRPLAYNTDERRLDEWMTMTDIVTAANTAADYSLQQQQLQLQLSAVSL